MRKLEKIFLAVLIGAMFFPLLFSTTTPNASAYTTHATISITSNSSFKIGENGVTSGSGTASDPWIIENWVISASSTSGIGISNTTAYFIIRNCLVENGEGDYAGIALNNVINGRIENNTCENNHYGIGLSSSSNDNLTGNTCSNNTYGIYLGDSSSNILTGNVISNNSYDIYNTGTTNTYSSNQFNHNITSKMLTFSETARTKNVNDNVSFSVLAYTLDSTLENVLHENDTVVSTDSHDWVMVKQYSITRAGLGIITFGLAGSYDSDGDFVVAAHGRIWRNGVPVGTEHESLYDETGYWNSGYENFNEEICGWSVGDNVQLWIYTVDGGVSSTAYSETFRVSFYDFNCAITVSPSESSLSYGNNGGTVAGSFTPTKLGTYSLNFTVTDKNSNTTKRRMVFFVGNTTSTTTTYYVRGVKPTHGQPHGGTDARSLLLTAPTSTENVYCGIWIQHSPDEIPNYPLANLSSINTYTWYKCTQSEYIGAYIGAERYVLYDATVDASNPVDNASNYTWLNENLAGLNWGMDYPQNWYLLSLKLAGNSPNWVTFPPGHSASEASYADFVYSYTTTPVIKSISNPNIVILSATAPVDDNENATIVLDGTGSTNIVLDNYHRPFIGYTTTINSDNTATIAANGLTGTTTINSVAMDVTPSSGYINVSIDNWNTSGTYYKKWTENGSSGITASHTIGDLKANTYYMVKVDGTTFDTYQSDSSGQITFTYDGDYSTKTFEVEEHIPPNKPINLQPSARQTTTNVTLSCVVTDNDNNRMNVFFYNNADNSLIDNVWTDNGTTASVVWSGRVRGQTYTFFVGAQDNNGAWGENSDSQTFKVNWLPSKTQMKTEAITDPTGLTMFTPTFSWDYSDNDNDVQSDYQIQVGVSENDNSMWDNTGTTLAQITYSGNALSRGITYHVRVRTKDNYEWSSWGNGTFALNNSPTVTVGSSTIELGLVDVGDAPVISVPTLTIKLSIKARADDLLIYYARIDELPSIPAGGAVPFYFVISTNNPDAIGDVTLTFDIPKSWVAANDIIPSTLVAWRNSTGTWQTLPSRLVSEDALYYYSEATTHGFSLFSVSGQKKTTTDQPTEPTPSTPQTSTSDQQAQQVIFTVALGILLISTMLLASTFKHHKRRK